MYNEINDMIKVIMKLFADGRYDIVEQISNSIRLSQNDIRDAIKLYGCKIVNPPDEAYQYLDSIKIDNANTDAWSVDMPFWTQEEGRSDLTLSMTIIKNGIELVIEIDDIHVI